MIDDNLAEKIELGEEGFHNGTPAKVTTDEFKSIVANNGSGFYLFDEGTALVMEGNIVCYTPYVPMQTFNIKDDKDGK